jgi:flagellar motor switch protein FliN/FliY
MNSADLNQHLAGVEQALGSFLSMLLGEDVAFKAEAPAAVSRAEAKLETMARLVLLRTAGAGDGFAVLLEPGWLPLLSKAMLGEAMEIQDEGAEDLVRELAGQGYGAVRNQLGGDGIKLPDVTFDILVHGNQIPADALPDALWQVSFRADAGEASLRGVAVLAASSAEKPPAAEPAPRQKAAPAGRAPSVSVPDFGQIALGGPAPGPPVSIAPAVFPELGREGLGGDGDNFNLLAEVELEVTVELGRRKLPLADVLRLTTGSVIELENLVGEPLEVFANGRLIAEGEAIVIDEQFGIRITRLVSDKQRTRAFL